MDKVITGSGSGSGWPCGLLLCGLLRLLCGLLRLLCGVLRLLSGLLRLFCGLLSLLCGLLRLLCRRQKNHVAHGWDLNRGGECFAKHVAQA